MLNIHKDVKDLTLNEVKEIYYNYFYKKYNFDLIQNKLIAFELFEFTVNTGNHRLAVKNLQRAFNVLNENILLEEDGILGPKTANAINNYKFYKSLYKVLNVFQGIYYIALAEENKTLKNDLITHKTTQGSKWAKKFVRGWFDKRVF
jgi:lysozyme family protein